ncbi:porin family protein [Kaistia dalseonensis]|uniref:Outer membrane immunogenic protein n=1 Tax=Kaistia dalseonensis TaxID=410840 RepID=A0ABU0H180_9HYPH|nr:outer membrane protein [Kaistia dalseonensis]MCX5493508.1 porin family protein [Kaistia dalseonensis]MDQ0436068.1 outer membrane immunogenic protein [Kaistia dalseonensis]
MKNFLLAGAAVLAMTGAASAADLTVEPAPVAPIVSPVFDWSGFYVGVHGGGGWGSFGTSLANSFFDDASGAFGGAQIGYNYQTGPLVLGVQTDMAFANINSTGSLFLPNDTEAKLKWLGMTTLRAGYAADTWLFYGKGGVAYGELEAGISWLNASASSWQVGWTLGAGVEKAFTKNITGFLEYDYVDLGSNSINTSLGNSDVDFTTSLVKVGLNYKF